MSADNWAYCPQCQPTHGRPGWELYDRPEFREDYEFWDTESGTVKVSYSGRCRLCDLGLDFESAHPLPLKEAK